MTSIRGEWVAMERRGEEKRKEYAYLSGGGGLLMESDVATLVLPVSRYQIRQF